MGKPKSKKSSRAQKLAKRKQEPSYSLEELLGRAGELLDECQFELAEKFCQRALELDADHPQAGAVSSSNCYATQPSFNNLINLIFLLIQ